MRGSEKKELDFRYNPTGLGILAGAGSVLGTAAGVAISGVASGRLSGISLDEIPGMTARELFADVSIPFIDHSVVGIEFVVLASIAGMMTGLLTGMALQRRRRILACS